jgi:hypothetical protein
MGWLFGKKGSSGEDGLYRGDAPASAPGLDGLEPTSYQRSATYPGSGTYQSTVAPEARAYLPPAGSAPTVSATPYASPYPNHAQTQQRANRTLTRSLIGFLVPILLIGGLVVTGFVVVGNYQDEISNVFESAPAEEVQALQGVVGEPAEVTVGGNSYRITIQTATAASSAAPGSIFSPASGGFLVIELSLTRTDTNSAVRQISWFDWKFTSDTDTDLDSDLIGGGYEPLLSTLNLEPDATATGLIVFDTTASAGTLSLTNFEGTWAQWPISATAPGMPGG